jgi:hypothetical protein
MAPGDKILVGWKSRELHKLLKEYEKLSRGNADRW